MGKRKKYTDPAHEKYAESIAWKPFEKFSKEGLENWKERKRLKSMEKLKKSDSGGKHDLPEKEGYEFKKKKSKGPGYRPSRVKLSYEEKKAAELREKKKTGGKFGQVNITKDETKEKKKKKKPPKDMLSKSQKDMVGAAFDPPKEEKEEKPVDKKETKAGDYPIYKKEGKKAGDFRSAFAKACAGKDKTSSFSWNGKSYHCGTKAQEDAEAAKLAKDKDKGKKDDKAHQKAGSKTDEEYEKEFDDMDKSAKARKDKEKKAKSKKQSRDWSKWKWSGKGDMQDAKTWIKKDDPAQGYKGRKVKGGKESFQTSEGKWVTKRQIEQQKLKKDRLSKHKEKRAEQKKSLDARVADRNKRLKAQKEERERKKSNRTNRGA